MREGGRRLIVISDLHLGGRPHGEGGAGFQICNAYRELVALVDWLGGEGRSGETLELVVNGDIVDFLAEDDFGGGVGRRRRGRTATRRRSPS